MQRSRLSRIPIIVVCCIAASAALAGCGSSGGGNFAPVRDGGADGDVPDLAGAVADLAPGPDLAQVADPCGGVPQAGVCVGQTRVDRCVVPTGQGTPSVVTETCKAWQECKVVSGTADCVLRAGACEPGTSECVGTESRRVCDGNGAWKTEACPQCKSGGFGATCSGSSTLAYTGFVRYEARGPNTGYTGWSSTVSTHPAQGVLAVSYIFDSTTNSYKAIDSTTTDGTGKYTLKVPISPGSKDSIVFWAVRARAGGLVNGMAYAVAIPAVPDGSWNVGQPIPDGQDLAFWGWESLTQQLPAQNATITITEADGSGALRIFDYLRYAFGATETLTGKTGMSLVIWMRPNTSWSCGACMLPSPKKVLGYDFSTQIFIPATAQDTSYWSDAVNVHEIGHWMMRSYGTSPGEGGPHAVGCPTFPGQAWSEGWATGFSSLVRANSKYYDKQQGTFFWLDIALRKYSFTNVTWKAPTPQGGLLQLMDENEVSAMLWAMADTPTDSSVSLSANQRYFAAMSSARMNTKPFKRGYTTHKWQGSCQRSNITDTGISAPMFADYLDALRCAGFSAARVDAATQPQTRYPYPSNNPICQ